MSNNWINLNRLLKRLNPEQQEALKKALENISRRQNIYLVKSENTKHPTLHKKRDAPARLKASGFSWAMGAVVFLSMPCHGDLDGSHSVQSYFHEIKGLINGPQWTDCARQRWRRSDPEQREFIAALLKA